VPTTPRKCIEQNRDKLVDIEVVRGLVMGNDHDLPGSLMTRFGVKNYKCLKDIDIPLTPIHVIIGQNDAGKTSLLQAMFALFRTSVYPLSHAFPGKWAGTDLVFEHANSPAIELRGTFQIEAIGKRPAVAFEYGLAIKFRLDSHPTRFAEWCIDAQDGIRVEIAEKGAKWTRVGQATEDFEVKKGLLFTELKNCLQPVHFYQFDPKMMAMPATIDPYRKFRMDADGFGLASLLDDLLGYDPERFIELRRRFCDFFPQFRSVRLEVQDAVRRNYDDTGAYLTGAAPGKGIFFETRTGKSIRAQQASDGAILFLGFLALTSLPVPPKLILIEEPEKGVYPKRLEEIVKLLRNVVSETPEASRPQIILSTHSPYLVSFFAPEEVTLMSRDAGNGVVAHPMRDIPHIKERLGGGEFFLGELWYNLSEEELFGGAPLQTA